ncbi:hypothetical protein [Thermohalobacter berrensis]|uniref:Uncharacterized protein n=1 Tax=Thermohalobacter berrensis TaxID=99594 RepID=A0A419T1C8_9FIRM|nr:hypothetical protein [Thermohalobacter berrensis]RKD31229.1 hypothetical protein BET03_03625 [Thermohalobacter berrensis]
MKNFIKNVVVVAVVAFILQLIWEYVQCDIFYTMDESTNHTRLMFSATFGDMMMSVVLYGLLAFVNKDVNWILKKWNRHDYIITTLYALFLSFYFEISALYNNRWGYNEETMPLFPNTNIALVPVIQLIVLFPIIFIISRKILRRLNK